MPRLELSTYRQECRLAIAGVDFLNRRTSGNSRRTLVSQGNTDRSNSIQFGEILRHLWNESFACDIDWKRPLLTPFEFLTSSNSSKNGFITIVILIAALEIAISETNLAKGILQQPVFPTQHKFQLPVYEATFPNSNFKSKWYIEYVLRI